MLFDRGMDWRSLHILGKDNIIHQLTVNKTNKRTFGVRWVVAVPLMGAHLLCFLKIL